MCSLTLVSSAWAIILLNMVLQTKYEAMQEIVPSVPGTQKELLIRIKNLPQVTSTENEKKKEAHYIEGWVQRKNQKNKAKIHFMFF